MNLDINNRHLEIPCGIDFSSNDYLGLSQSSTFKHKLIEFIESEKYLWSSSSRLISGTTPLHLEVENHVAEFLNRESALLFLSGYSANCGVISTLCSESLIFSDELNHASLIDGIQLSRSECVIYPHNDLETLEKLLKKFESSPKPKFIITESLFSMEGTLTPINPLVTLTQKFGASLILDEAHSTGVYGSQGQGLLASLNIDSTLDPHKIISIHTGGKALGACGAFVGCSSTIKDILINKCRHFIYTTAPHPLNLFLLKTAVDHVKNSPELRERLFKNIAYMQRQIRSRKTSLESSSEFQPFFNASFDRTPSKLSPIIPWIYPGNENILKLSKNLKNLGFYVKAIRSPTVPYGKERLRISIHANHQEENINALVTAIKDLMVRASQKITFT